MEMTMMTMTEFQVKCWNSIMCQNREGTLTQRFSLCLTLQNYNTFSGLHNNLPPLNVRGWMATCSQIQLPELGGLDMIGGVWELEVYVLRKRKPLFVCPFGEITHSSRFIKALEKVGFAPQTQIRLQTMAQILYNTIPGKLKMTLRLLLSFCLHHFGLNIGEKVKVVTFC